MICCDDLQHLPLAKDYVGNAIRGEAGHVVCGAPWINDASTARTYPVMCLPTLQAQRALPSRSLSSPMTPNRNAGRGPAVRLTTISRLKVISGRDFGTGPSFRPASFGLVMTSMISCRKTRVYTRVRVGSNLPQEILTVRRNGTPLRKNSRRWRASWRASRTIACSRTSIRSVVVPLTTRQGPPAHAAPRPLSDAPL